MHFIELWNLLLGKHPKFADDDYQVKLSARGLKKMLEDAYDIGHQKGVANGRALEQMEAEKKSSTTGGFRPFRGRSFVDDMFGPS